MNCFPEPHTHQKAKQQSKIKVEVELDLSNYAKKSDLKKNQQVLMYHILLKKLI